MLVSNRLWLLPTEIVTLRHLARENLEDPSHCVKFLRAVADTLADTSTQDGETASRIMALFKIAAYAIHEALNILDNVAN